MKTHPVFLLTGALLVGFVVPDALGQVRRQPVVSRSVSSSVSSPACSLPAVSRPLSPPPCVAPPAPLSSAPVSAWPAASKKVAAPPSSRIPRQPVTCAWVFSIQGGMKDMLPGNWLREAALRRRAAVPRVLPSRSRRLGYQTRLLHRQHSVAPLDF